MGCTSSKAAKDNVSGSISANQLQQIDVSKVNFEAECTRSVTEYSFY